MHSTFRGARFIGGFFWQGRTDILRNTFSFLFVSLIFFLLPLQYAHAQFPTIFNVPPAVAPSSIGQNTQLNLHDGGVLGSSFVAHSGSFSQPAEVNIYGGIVGDSFQAEFASRINISGGEVGNLFKAHTGSEVNISDGSIGDEFKVFDLSTVNISGGSVGDFFTVFQRSSVHISGGTFGDHFRANNGSIVNVTGGSFGNAFGVSPDSVVSISGGMFERMNAVQESTVHLFGSEFRIGGEEIEGLVAGQPFTITDRDVSLTGTFIDGSPFDFDLSSTFSLTKDIFSSNGTLTVTFVNPVPEPGGMMTLVICSLTYLAHMAFNRRQLRVLVSGK